MNLRNLQIGTQLKLGYAMLMLFVVILGAVAYRQSGKIQRQTEIIYQHPFMVQRTIGILRYDIVIIQRNMKDMFLITDEASSRRNINQIEICDEDAFRQLDSLNAIYLGPRSDIDSVRQALIIWNTLRDETLILLRTGKTAEAAGRTKSTGLVSNQVENILTALQKVDRFSMQKADALYTSSGLVTKSLNRQLLLLVFVILILSLVISSIVQHNIRKPLRILTDAAKRFGEGDLNARSSYCSTNETGRLSDSFNTLADAIQLKSELDARVASLASLMLSEYDTKKFFQATLNALAEHTNSQMAAIYLLSEDKKQYDHFESTGVDNNARKSFEAGSFEGEFGAVIASRTVRHLRDIPEDTRFVFHTVSGKFIPREIITLPILAGDDVVAIISLASVTSYSNQSILLIDRILVTFSARVEGILAYHKIKEFSALLGSQNRELEAQKSELAAQTAELMGQNNELEIQKQQLDESSRLKTNFLSNMSHELRTPLNSVIALTGVLSRRLTDKIPREEYSYLEVIERNGRHLLNLINDILDISRIEAGREETEFTAFNVNDLIAEVVSMIQPQASEKNIALLQLPGDSTLVMNSDSGKCRHILQNLVANAVKFTEKGTVSIGALQNETRITFVITDTGIGIAENHLPHIFDEFRQADGSTSRRFGGTGLGLAIAKKYATLLGGTISVNSVIGTGSTFTLMLPLAYSSENRVNKAAEAPAFKQTTYPSRVFPVEGSTPRTILLVDDSEPSVIQIKDILAESGHSILVARNGDEALRVIDETIPDAMILDLMMPGKDGFEVLRTLRNNETTFHIPVLILTAKHITKEELSFLKRNNIHQLIQKGDVNRVELVSAVATMITPKTAGALKLQAEPIPIIGKPVVLVIEDNPDNMVTVRALLADNCSVLEATDGVEGIAMAGRHKPNLILMDIALPGVDGIQAFKTIRTNPHLYQIPVIALTASAMITDRETILSHGFDGYLAKPIEEKLFFEMINSILYGR